MKKILSVFLDLIMIVILFVVSILFVGRLVLGGPSLSKVVKVLAEEEGGFSEMFDIEGLDSKIDEDALCKEFGYLFSDLLKYETGVTDEKPDFSDIKKIILKYVDDLEEETGETLSDEELAEIFDDFENEMFEIFDEDVSEEVRMIFKVIYSNTILLVLISLLIGCALLNYLARKDWAIVSRHSGIVFIINAIIVFGVKSFVDLVGQDVSYEDGRVLIVLLSECILTVDIISLICGVGLIVLSIVLKKKNNNGINNMNGQYSNQTNSYSNQSMTYNNFNNNGYIN